MWWLELRETVVRFEVEDGQRRWWVGPIVAMVVAGEENKERKEDEKVGQNPIRFLLIDKIVPF